jgi:hypothetical protein
MRRTGGSSTNRRQLALLMHCRRVDDRRYGTAVNIDLLRNAVHRVASSVRSEDGFHCCHGLPSHLLHDQFNWQ